MTIEDKIRNEKLQYDINREVAKIGKYEYFTGQGILPSNQSQMIEQAKFTYSLSGKAQEKQTKRQIDALKSFKLSSKIDE